MLDTFSMVKQISVIEQRYQAVLAVIADGRGVGEVAPQFGVSRQSAHAWLCRYEDDGLEGLANRSVKPKSMPHHRGRKCRGVARQCSGVTGGRNLLCPDYGDD